MDGGLDDRIGAAGGQVVVGGDESVVDLGLLPQATGGQRGIRPQNESQ